MDNQIITGYPSLDKILGGGLHPGEVTVLAGSIVDATDILSLNILLNNLFLKSLNVNLFNSFGSLSIYS